MGACINGADESYISWWPEEHGRIRSKLNDDIYAVSSPRRDQTFEDDQWGEGGRVKKVPPNHSIWIQGLDENAIKLWWANFGLVQGGQLLQGPLPNWSSLQQNCATVVAMALVIGGGKDHASWMNSWNIIGSPNKVQQFAEDIQRNIMR